MSGQPAQVLSTGIEAATNLAQELQLRHGEYLSGKIRTYNRTSNWASSLSDDCLRRLVLYRTHGEQAAPHDINRQAIFDAGNLYEPIVERLLSELGIRILQQQRGFPDNEWQVRGRIDGKVVWRGHVLVVDIKTAGTTTFSQCSTHEDMLRSRFPWVRAYPDQLHVYIYLERDAVRRGLLRADERPEAGLIVFWDKAGGRLKAVPVPYDEERAKHLVEVRASEVNRHLAEGTLPEGINRAEICLECPLYGRACQPEIRVEGHVAVMDDEDLLEALETRQQCQDAAHSYEEADRLIKKVIRARLGEEQDGVAVAGDWMIRTKVSERKGYEVKPGKSVRVTVEPRLQAAS